MPEANQEAFMALCERCKRNNLVVEIMVDSLNRTAVCVFKNEQPQQFTVGKNRTPATMRVGVVASPFTELPPEAHAHQLDQMLAARGYN